MRNVSVENVLSIWILVACAIVLVEGILYILHKNNEDKAMLILAMAFVAILLLMKILLEYVVYSVILQNKYELIMAGIYLLIAGLLYKKKGA